MEQVGSEVKGFGPCIESSGSHGRLWEGEWLKESKKTEIGTVWVEAGEAL